MALKKNSNWERFRWRSTGSAIRAVVATSQQRKLLTWQSWSRACNSFSLIWLGEYGGEGCCCIEATVVKVEKKNSNLMALYVGNRKKKNQFKKWPACVSASLVIQRTWTTLSGLSPRLRRLQLFAFPDSLPYPLVYILCVTSDRLHYPVNPKCCTRFFCSLSITAPFSTIWHIWYRIFFISFYMISYRFWSSTSGILL